MSLGFAEIIGWIEAELCSNYWPGAIQWCDETMNGAWSTALMRFDNALSIAIERMDYALAKSEGQFYKETILSLIKKYKAHKQMGETESFLEALR